LTTGLGGASSAELLDHVSGTALKGGAASGAAFTSGAVWMPFVTGTGLGAHAGGAVLSTGGAGLTGTDEFPDIASVGLVGAAFMATSCLALKPFVDA